MQDPASALVDLLVTGAATHFQRRIHVNVVGCEIQTDQSLEDNAPSRESLCQKHKETGCGASVRDHVEDSTE